MDKFKFGSYSPPPYYEFDEKNDRHPRDPAEFAAYEARGCISLYTDILTAMVKNIKFLKLCKGMPLFDDVRDFRRALRNRSNTKGKETENRYTLISIRVINYL